MAAHTRRWISCFRWADSDRVIAGPLEWLEARQRKQGWEDALKIMGILSPRSTGPRGLDLGQRGAAFAELIQKYPRLDAVFVSNDQMALGVLHLTNTRGIRVPETWQ